MKKHITLLFSLLGLAICTFAQSIHFPKGKTNDFFTQVDVLYFETEIRFYTRGCISTDMKWEILSDSLDQRWDISSCFNGDCLVAIPRNGSFISDYGINDTTVFIRFHVNTLKHTGVSKISARVFHKNNPAVNDTIHFVVRYSNPESTGITEVNNSPLNYRIQDGTLLIDNFSGQVNLLTPLGQCIQTSSDNTLQLPHEKGWYVLQCINKDGLYQNRIIIW